MREDPIVIFCSPRGGSSLVAGIFVAHGIWVGETFGGPDGRGSGGYVNHENAKIKAYIKKHWPLDAGNPMKDPGAADLFSYCQSVVPADKVWMFKGPAEYYPIFDYWYPQMRPVFVFRDERQAVEAHVRRRGESVRSNAERIVKRRYEYMRRISKETREGHLPVSISADDVVGGVYIGFQEVLYPYDIQFDRAKARATLKPELWHS